MKRAEQTTANPWTWLVAVIGVLGAWSIVVPFLGPALGLKLDVSRTVEIVDHVVPGVELVGCSLGLLWLMRAGRSGSILTLAIASALALAGLWITATHVPLLLDAGRGVVPWGTALYHTASGPPILASALALVVHEARVPEARPAPDPRDGRARKAKRRAQA